MELLEYTVILFLFEIFAGIGSIVMSSFLNDDNNPTPTVILGSLVIFFILQYIFIQILANT